MDDDPSFHQNELSPEDLEIVRAFDALTEVRVENVPAPRSLQEHDTLPSAIDTNLPTNEEMLLLFVSEVDEDLGILQQTFQHLEPDDQLDPGRLLILQRTAHKLKGTTGSMECVVLSSIAYAIEAVAKLLATNALAPFVGRNALIQAIQAFERTFYDFVTAGKESDTALAELEAEYQALNIALPAPRKSSLAGTPVLPPKEKMVEETPVRILLKPGSDDDTLFPHVLPRTEQELSTSLPIDIHRFESLVTRTEQLVDLRAPLENAQAQVDTALAELQLAQTRLWRLETLFSSLALSSKFPRPSENTGYSEERSHSSLITRILNEAQQRTGHSYQRKNRYTPSSLYVVANRIWDEMEIDRYTDTEVLVQSLSEAIADITTASTSLHRAFARLQAITQQHIQQAGNVRKDTLLLRLAPLHLLLSRIERAVKMSTLAQQEQVEFEAAGEDIEIEQDMLEALKQPLLQLVRTCTAASSFVSLAEEGSEQSQKKTPYRIWFHASAIGSEVSIEVGFSMNIHGGALEELQAGISHVHGSITVRRNEQGGISFFLRIPRSQGAVQGILVRVGKQQLIVPFFQVQRIDYSDYGEQPASEVVYHLSILLGFPRQTPSADMKQSVLKVALDTADIGIQVDEVVDEVELVVRPLASHLQRPGILGTAIDGMGNVLLVVNLPELLRNQDLSRHSSHSSTLPSTTDESDISSKAPASRTVLIADDSIFIRTSLATTLRRAGYHVSQARDGMEALEAVLEQPPHVLLLDVEMPNLNGYDLLHLLHDRPELASTKTIMLTSRSSEKHEKRAYELGARAYLSKPCSEDTLLATLQKVLDNP